MLISIGPFLSSNIYIATCWIVLNFEEATVAIDGQSAAIPCLVFFPTQSAANKSAGAAVSRASNAAQTFVTQTQTQNRLLGNNASNGDQANFNGETKRFGFLNGGNQLAMAYGESIKRPDGGQTWHSKDLTNAIRQRSASRKREKEQLAVAGLQKLGIDVTSEIAQPLAFKSKFDVWMAGGITKVDSSRTDRVPSGGVTVPVRSVATLSGRSVSG